MATILILKPYCSQIFTEKKTFKHEIDIISNLCSFYIQKLVIGERERERERERPVAMQLGHIAHIRNSSNQYVHVHQFTNNYEKSITFSERLAVDLSISYIWSFLSVKHYHAWSQVKKKLVQDCSSAYSTRRFSSPELKARKLVHFCSQLVQIFSNISSNNPILQNYN